MEFGDEVVEEFIQVNGFIFEGAGLKFGEFAELDDEIIQPGNLFFYPM